jgi:hypothetical protein
MKLNFFLKNLSMSKSSQTLHSFETVTVRHIENGPRARECTLQPSLTELFPALTHTFHLVQSLGRSDEVEFFSQKSVYVQKLTDSAQL